MSMQRDALFVDPDLGRLVDVGGDRVRIIKRSRETGDDFSVAEVTVYPGGGTPPHIHTREEEAFYILEGELTAYLEGVPRVLKAGAFALLPRWKMHHYRNESDRPARYLITLLPGGFEEAFLDAGIPVTDPNVPPAPPTPEHISRLMDTVQTRYGLQVPAETGAV